MNRSISPWFQASCCARRMERIWTTAFVRSCSLPAGAAEIDQGVGAKSISTDAKSAGAIGWIKPAFPEVEMHRWRITGKGDIFYKVCSAASSSRIALVASREVV
jgi:hypothetical protein